MRERSDRRVALDSSALIAYANEDPQAIALLQELWRSDVLLVAPTPILAETLRGGRTDAAVNRVLAKMVTVDTTVVAGRRAGELLGSCKAPASLTLDALIIATSLEAHVDGIITADVADHRRIAPPGFSVIALHAK